MHLFGDNGIISNAQNANIKSGMAVLEEFLHEKYVEEYDDIDDQSFVLDSLLRVYPEYFYIPQKEGYGSLNYIENDGKSLYLIRKSGLPKEIQDSLNGGNAGEGKYSDYASLNDVYGVTQKLKVYYCSKGIDSISGLSKDDIDDAVDRIVFQTTAGGLGELLAEYDYSNDGNITTSEIRDIKSIEITSNIDLKDIYNLYALEKITIKDVSNIDLTGIEDLTKLNFIWFFNSNAQSYQPIGLMGERLKRLYFQHFSQDDVNKFVDDIKSYDLSNLEYLSFWNTGIFSHGPQYYMKFTDRNDFGQSANGITSLSKLNELSSSTKNAIKYFYVEGNKLTSLDGITSFPNLVILKIYRNNLATLDGIGSLKSLEYLQCSRNLLTDSVSRDETLKAQDSLYSIAGCTKLKWLDISYNSNIVWISYISSLPIETLYMDGLLNLSTTDVLAMKDKINSMSIKTFDKKYSFLLMDTSTTKLLDLTSQTLTVADLLNVGTCTKLTNLYLMNTQIKKADNETLALDEDTVEELMIKVFSNLKSINYLDIAGLTIDLDDGNGAQKIKNLNFINSNLYSNLNWIDLRDTDVIAMGENSTVSESNKALSISNSTLLNSITSLKTFIVNTPNFDFYYMQDLVNRMKNNNRPSSYYDAGGLCCFNNTSLKTLEKCDKITNIQTYKSNSRINNENTLDLSNCDKLKLVNLCGWNGVVNLPSSIKNIYTTLTSMSFTFENDGTDIILDRVIIDECAYGIWGRITNEFANSGVFVNNYSLSSIWGEGAIDVFFDSEGKCEWINCLNYNYAFWKNPYDYSRFYSEFNKLIGSSITKIQFSRAPVTNLDFLNGFEDQLESIIITRSKIQNINNINNFTNLTELKLNNNLITNLSALENMTSLKVIDFSENNIGGGIGALETLVNLETLSLNGNDLFVDEYINVATGEVKESFINIFKDLHVNNKLKNLDLRNTNLKNIRNSLNVAPTWEKLNCDS